MLQGYNSHKDIILYGIFFSNLSLLEFRHFISTIEVIKCGGTNEKGCFILLAEGKNFIKKKKKFANEFNAEILIFLLQLYI